jgi:hypothetical protein
MTDTPPLLLDCDILVGHDVTTGRWGRPENVAKVLTDSGISGGVVSSLRAVHFDVPTGNDEARQVADGNGWTMCPVLDLRDPLGAEKELERQLASATPPRAVRLAPTAQSVEPGYPAFGHVVQLLVDAGLTIFTEGDVRKVGPAMRGLGARVVFLDTHFYYLGPAGVGAVPGAAVPPWAVSWAICWACDWITTTPICFSAWGCSASAIAVKSRIQRFSAPTSCSRVTP